MAVPAEVRADLSRLHDDEVQHSLATVAPAATLPLPTAELDWPQVVALRRRASEEIAGESEHQLRTTGTPITGDDRLLLVRSTWLQLRSAPPASGRNYTLDEGEPEHLG